MASFRTVWRYQVRLYDKFSMLGESLPANLFVGMEFIISTPPSKIVISKKKKKEEEELNVSLLKITRAVDVATMEHCIGHFYIVGATNGSHATHGGEADEKITASRSGKLQTF